MVACLVFLGGVAVGTAAGTPTPRQETHAGGYRILSGDFHVHGFPGDGALPPWSYREEARFAGIDVFGQTNHNQALTGRLGEWISAGAEPLVIAGEEVTNADYHMIALGITTTIRADQPAASAIADIHAQGGVAIAAHPIASFRGWDDAALATLDGVEVAHPVRQRRGRAASELTAFYARARRLNPDVAAIGSSDVHMTATLGECRTLVFVREATRDGVLQAIRTGMTVAMDHDGKLYGPPDLVHLVTRPVGRVDPHPSLRRLSVALTFAGLLGMLLLRGSQRR